jgi:hypothetical protein
MKNTKNKFNAVDYVNQMNHLYSNGPKPRGDTIQQLLDLKEWSQNPEAYYKKLKNSKYINNPKKLEAFVRSEDPVPRAKTQPKAVKVAGIKDTALYKTLKDPRVLGIDLGTDTIREIINLIQNSGLVKKPKPEPTIPIEEKINQIAYQRKLAEDKFFGLNEEFAKQKLRERMS